MEALRGTQRSAGSDRPSINKQVLLPYRRCVNHQGRPVTPSAGDILGRPVTPNAGDTGARPKTVLSGFEAHRWIQLLHPPPLPHK